MFANLTHLFILHMFSKHSVPFHVTLDRDLEFVLNFFCSLGTTLYMWLHFTLSYYPEDDRQTESINQTLEQYLYIYCNYQQDNCSELLLLVEFSYNNISNATTSIFLFIANKKYHLNITIYPKHDIASSQAYNFTIDLNKLQSTLKAEITIVQEYYQKFTDV